MIDKVVVRSVIVSIVAGLSALTGVTVLNDEEVSALVESVSVLVMTGAATVAVVRTVVNRVKANAESNQE